MIQIRHTRPRRGFTILEMMIVCAIILILISLTAGAALRFMDVQRKRNTELTLSKLDSGLRQHWNAVISSAKDEAIPPAISTLAGNDARARVIYIKLRLLQEFPTSFSEATNPAGGLLQPRPSYQVALQGKTLTGVTGVNAGAIAANKLAAESSACLYLALQQDRNGTRFNVDSLLTSREVKTDPSGVKYIVDEWGTPLGFFRWPSGNPEITNASQSPIPATSSMLTAGTDTEDPTGLLSMSGNGWTPTKFSSIPGCHPVQVNKAFRLEPCIASAGRNQLWGLQTANWGTMTPTTPAADAYDNLASYRLRQNGRGD